MFFNFKLTLDTVLKRFFFFLCGGGVGEIGLTLMPVVSGFLSQQLNATQCNFCRAEVATSYDFIAILVQFVSVNVNTRLLLNKSCVLAKR